MKADDLKQVTEFSRDAGEMLLELMTPMLDERLTDQPVEAMAVYLANVRWAAYQAFEALSRLQRLAETSAPLWADPMDEYHRQEDAEDVRLIEMMIGVNRGS